MDRLQIMIKLTQFLSSLQVSLKRGTQREKNTKTLATVLNFHGTRKKCSYHLAIINLHMLYPSHELVGRR